MCVNLVDKHAPDMMRSILRHGLCTIFPLLAASLQAQQEDCIANFSWDIDPGDPLHVQFHFTGYTAPGTFQFLGVWDFGDLSTSTDSMPDHTYAQAGTYTVCLSFSVCIGGGLSCSDDTCFNVTVGTTGIFGPLDPNAFSMWPNPATDLLTVSLFSNAALPAQLTIVDARGKTVLEEAHDLVTGTNRVSVATDAWSPGTYLLRLKCGTSSLEQAFLKVR